MQVEPKEKEIVTPSPYYKIAFKCSNRAFYGVKSDLYELAEKIGIEIEDGYIDEKCDYEGDLEEITIYNGLRDQPLRDVVLEYYGVDKKEAEGMKIMLSIF